MELFTTDLKVARENAVIGNYSQANTIYNKVLKAAKEHILNYSGDPSTKLRWKTAIEQIQREAGLT